MQGIYSKTLSLRLWWVPRPSRDSTKLEIDDCVSHGIQAFGDMMPDRAYVLTRVLDGATVSDIGLEIGRTPGATKEYLSQCRKKVAPFIQECLELLAD